MEENELREEEIYETVNAPFEADEEDPYIFISYAHKSRNEVFPVIKRLYEKGWRIWYDEGLVIGDDYYSSLKRHIENCAAFLLFVTEASIKSTFVQEHEIPFAKELKKPFAECFLDKSLGLDLGEGVLVTDDAGLEETLEKIEVLKRGPERIAKGHIVKTNIPPLDNEYDYEVCDGGVRLGEYHGRNREVFIPSEYPPFSGLKVVELDFGVFTKDTTARIVHVPNSVKSIDWDTFSFARKITDIYVPSSVEKVARFGIVSRRIHCAEGSAAYEAVERHNARMIEEAENYQRFDWEKNGYPFRLGEEGFLKAVIDESLESPKEEAAEAYAYVSMAKERVDGYKELTDALVSKKCYIKVPSDDRDREKLFQSSKCIVALIDRDYLKGPGAEELRKALREKRKVAVYVTEECDMPEDLSSLQDMHQLRYSTGTESERIIKLANYLADNGCRDPHYIEGFQYSVTDKGIVLTYYEGEDPSPEIAEEYGGASVVSVSGAFKKNEKIENIKLPGSVKELESAAFMDCSALKKVELPAGLKEIPYRTFCRCKSLKEVVIPSTVASIGESAFEDCGSLESMRIPGSVASIGSQAFYKCASLKELVLGSGVKEICYGAFRYCTSLEKIEIPDGIDKIDRLVFEGDEKLKKNEYGNAYYLGNERNPYLVLLEAVSKDIETVKIAEGTRIICDRAFEECKKLREVIMPDSVIRIGEMAFKDCKLLEKVRFSESLKTMGISAFIQCSALKEALLPDSLEGLEIGTFSYCISLKYVKLPAGLKKPDGAFEHCYDIKFKKKWSLFG